MTDHVRSPLGPSRAQNKPTMRPELGQTTPKVHAPRIAQPARKRRKQLAEAPLACFCLFPAGDLALREDLRLPAGIGVGGSWLQNF